MALYAIIGIRFIVPMYRNHNVWGMSMTVYTVWFRDKREMKGVPIIVNLCNRAWVTYEMARSAEIFLLLCKIVQNMTAFTPGLHAIIIISVICKSRNTVHHSPQHMRI